MGHNANHNRKESRKEASEQCFPEQVTAMSTWDSDPTGDVSEII